MLTDILPVIKDRQTREIAENTAEKIGRLAENDYKNLAEATKKRFEIEMEREIRARNNEVREQERKR
ncbi:MAG: chemotaxis protein, partial [Lachnospiraceae bacterium]|nr:chemotaxis protein [Lachnospiraceae bacterium]